MRVLSERRVQVWINEWMRKNRPQDIKPFFATQMVCDFQTEMMEDNHADAEGKEPKDDQHEHQGIPRRQDL
jgi:hypothetical protein